MSILFNKKELRGKMNNKTDFALDKEKKGVIIMPTE